MGVTIIAREEWEAWEPFSRTPHELPAVTVLCSYTGTPACNTIATCREYMQRLQREHVKLNKLQDMPYNFVIGGDGNVYEARGWMLSPQLGEHEHDHRHTTNVYIAVTGLHGDVSPPQFEALEELIRFGVVHKLIVNNFNRVHIPLYVPKNVEKFRLDNTADISG